MQPVFKTTKNNQWQRIKYTTEVATAETFMELTFKHLFNDSYDPVYFAFTYPWSFQDNLVPSNNK